MKNSDFFKQSFGGLLTALNEVKNVYNIISIPSDRTDEDFEAILNNAEDRAKYNEITQKLKDNRMKGIGNKTETVKFSDRELEISID